MRGFCFSCQVQVSFYFSSFFFFRIRASVSVSLDKSLYLFTLLCGKNVDWTAVYVTEAPEDAVCLFLMLLMVCFFFYLMKTRCKRDVEILSAMKRNYLDTFQQKLLWASWCLSFLLQRILTTLLHRTKKIKCMDFFLYMLFWISCYFALWPF